MGFHPLQIPFWKIILAVSQFSNLKSFPMTQCYCFGMCDNDCYHPNGRCVCEVDPSTKEIYCKQCAESYRDSKTLCDSDGLKIRLTPPEREPEQCNKRLLRLLAQLFKVTSSGETDLTITSTREFEPRVSLKADCRVDMALQDWIAKAKSRQNAGRDSMDSFSSED